MKKIIFLTAIALSLCSCAKTELTGIEAGEMLIGASVEAYSSGTKAALADNDGSFTWQTGDAIGVATSDGHSTFNLKTGAETKSATFSAIYSGTLGNYAVYPADIFVSDSKIKVPASRVWSEGNTNCSMFGNLSEGNVAFKHLGGVVKVTLNGVPKEATKFVFSTPGKKITGEFELKGDADKYIETSDGTANSSYTLSFTLNEAQNMAFYIPVPCGTYPKFAFKVLGTGDAELNEFEGSSQQVVNRKDILIMPTLTIGTITGGGDDAEQGAISKTVPAGTKGNYRLPAAEKVILNFEGEDNPTDADVINLVYDGDSHLPSQLWLKVATGKKVNVSGELSYTHVEFDQGEISHANLLTSQNTFKIVAPAKISEKLVVKGGNVEISGEISGADNVKAIEIVAAATADGTSAPVQITLANKATVGTPEQGGENGGITTSANVVIVNNTDKPVNVTAPETVQVASAGTGGGVVKKNDEEVTTKPAAVIGTQNFITLSDAINAAQAGSTIEILNDIALDSPITISKSGITIDGKGKTIAVSDANNWNQYKIGGDKAGLGKVNMISVSGNDFTLKNVTLDGKECRGVSLCTTTGGKNVLYQNVTYTGRGSGHYYGEATGLVTFDGCKFDIHGYAIHFGGESSLDDDVVIKNCEVNGWSSFGKCKSLTISDSHFGGAEDKDKNGWLAVLRPYCPTTITNCTFSDIYLHTVQDGDGYYEELGLGTGAATTVILNGCKVVDNSKHEKAGVDIYSIVREAAFDNDAAKQGSVFAFDAEGNAADGFKSGTFYAQDPANIKLQEGYAYHEIEGKSYIYGIHEIVAVATIGSVKYETLDAATKAVQAGQTIEIVKAGTYTVPNILYNITVEGAVTDVVFNCEGSGSIASIPNGSTFKNVTMNFGNSGYHGFQHAGHIIMDGCILNGLFFSYGDMTFKGCTFNQENEEYNMWCYGNDVTYDGCTFNSKGKFLNVYNEGNDDGTPWNIVAKDCVFNTSKANKAALNIKETCNAIFLKYNVTVENCSCNELQNSLENKDDGSLYRVSPIWQVDDRKDGATGINVTVDGLKVYPFCSKDADGNYHIINAAGLLQFHDLYADGKVAYTAKVYIDNGIDFTGKTWTACEWHADGNKKGFALFDGQNHTIKNFTVNGQGMFSRWACTANIGATPYFKDIVFDGAKNVTSTLNVSLFCGQVYQNAKIENVTIKNSQFEGTYKVAPFVGSVYDENGRGPILTLKDCKVENTTIKGTSDDKNICGMVAWVNESNNDKITFEGDNVVKDVTLYIPKVSNDKCAKIYHNGKTAYDEAANVTVNNVNVIIAQ